MTSDLLLDLFAQYGYAIFFLSLCLGLFGPPVPAEAVALTAGAAAAGGLLAPAPAFVATCLGVVSGISVGYALGRYAGQPLIKRFKRKKKAQRYLDSAERGIAKYGLYAFPLCYFLPGARHLISYLFGAGRMSYGRYAIVAYTTGAVWCAVYFSLGYFVTDRAAKLAGYGMWLVGFALLAGAGAVIVHRRFAQASGRRSPDR